MNGFSAQLCGESIGPADHPIVYGRDVAVRHALEAFWKHGTCDSHTFFISRHGDGGENRAEHWLREVLKPCGRKQARIADIEELKADFNSFEIPVWHDFDAELMPAVSMRARLSRNLYPVTATVHVLSYQVVLGGWILPMLLGDVQACDALISTTHSCRRALENLIEHVRCSLRELKGVELPFHGRLPVIPISVDIEAFQPRDKCAARKSLGLPQEAFLLGWVGRVSAIDKADLVPLLQVFSRLVQVNPNRPLRLLIAGGGTEAALQALRGCAYELGMLERVLWLQPLPPEKRAQVFAALDLFTSPADNVQETAGITPLEALASGVPQVVSDWDGYRETVEHGITGFLVPTLWTECDSGLGRGAGLYDNYNLMDHFAIAQSVVVNQEAYQDALQCLIDHPELLRSMSEASRRRALALFHPQRVVNLHEDLWEDLRQVARHTPWQGSGSRGYDVPAWHRDFGHYASTNALGDALLALTEEGHATLSGGSELKTFGSTPAGMTAASLSAALGAAAAADGFHPAVDRIAAQLQLPRDRAERHLLWLIKRHFFTCSQA